MPVGGIPTIGRNTQGVRLIRLEEGEQVSTVERLAEQEEGERKEVDAAVLAAQAEREAEPPATEEGIEDPEEEPQGDGES